MSQHTIRIRLKAIDYKLIDQSAAEIVDTAKCTGAIELPAHKALVLPQHKKKNPKKPKNPIAMKEGLRFAIRDGGRTVGAGVVAKIIA